MTANAEYPPYPEQVIVTCVGFSCLGRYVGERLWRSAYKNELLPGVTAWRFIGSDKWHPLVEPGSKSAGALSPDHLDKGISKLLLPKITTIQQGAPEKGSIHGPKTANNKRIQLG